MKNPLKGFRPALTQTVRTSWPVLLMVSILFFITHNIIPLMACSLQVNQKPDNNAWLRLVTELFADSSILFFFTVFFVALIAFFSAFTLFGYLRDRKSTDFYHSLPVTRTAQYAANLTVGILQLLLPLVLTVALAFFMLRMYIPTDALSTATLFSMLWCYTYQLLLIYVQFFAFATLAVILTGSFLSSVLMYAMELFYVIAIAFVTGIANQLYNGELLLILTHDINQAMTLSPAFRMVLGTTLIPYTVPEIILSALGTLALFVLSGILLWYRKSENCKQPLAFDRMTNPYMFLICHIVALFSAYIFMIINNKNWVWGLVGAAIGMFITFLLLNAIFNGNIRQVLHKPLRLPIFFGLFLLVFAFTVMEPVQLYTFALPPAEQVESAAIATNYRTLRDGYGKTEDDKYQQMILDMFEHNARMKFTEGYTHNEYIHQTDIRTHYTKNGREFENTYAMTPDQLEPFLPLLKELYKEKILLSQADYLVQKRTLIAFTGSYSDFANISDARGHMEILNLDENSMPSIFYTGAVETTAVVIEEVKDVMTEEDDRTRVVSKKACEAMLNALEKDLETAKLSDFSNLSPYTVDYTVLDTEHNVNTNMSMAIPANFTNTIAVLKQYVPDLPSEDKLYNALADQIQALEIWDMTTGEQVNTVKHRDEIIDLLHQTSNTYSRWESELYIQQNTPYTVITRYPDNTVSIRFFNLDADPEAFLN